MGLFDRPPGDDRFAPPPGSTDPSPEPTGPRAGRRIFSVAVAVPLLRLAAHHYGPRAWWAAAGLFVLTAAEYVVGLKRAAKRSPYAPDTHVTR